MARIKKPEPTGDGDVFSEEDLAAADRALDSVPIGYYDGWNMRRAGKPYPAVNPADPLNAGIRMGWNDLHVQIANGDFDEPAPGSVAAQTSPIIGMIPWLEAP